MAGDPVSKHFFQGFIRLHILYHAAKAPIYGAEIAEELVRHGYRVSQGTLYPTLHLMQELSYLRRATRVVNGRRRKYYRATPAGRQALAAAREKLLELVAEVIEDRNEPFLKIQKRHQAARTASRRSS